MNLSDYKLENFKIVKLKFINIKRKKYQEMLLHDLYKIIRLKNRERGMKRHLREMIGGLKLDIIQTTIGPLVRINPAMLTK